MASYSGRMLVPHFGLDPGPTDPAELAALAEGDVISGERLETSDPFYDRGFKVRYNIGVNGSRMQIYAGVKNLFNSYQPAFDKGYIRDPGYVYGPGQPRHIYLGFKIGNRLLNQ